MRFLPLAVALFAGLGLASCPAGGASSTSVACALAPDAGSSDSSDAVVVTVGRSEVRAHELGALLAGLGAFERQTYGATPELVKRNFVERRLIPGLLAKERACEQRLDVGTGLGARLNQELVERLDDDLTRSIESQLTPKEIRDYCRAEGKDGGSGACTGDPAGYRVALTRTKKTRALAELATELRTKNVHSLSYAPLEEIEVTASGVRPRPRK